MATNGLRPPADGQISHPGTGQITNAWSAFLQDIVSRAGGLPITGGTMLGPLILAGAPSVALGAATKGYVDSGFTPLSVASVGEYRGTATNDNATAGNVGEYVSSTVLIGSEVMLGNNAAANVTTISLTAGDWDVSGTVCIAPDNTTLVTSVSAWTSSISALLPTLPNNGGLTVWVGSPPAGLAPSQPAGVQRFSLAAPAVVYLSASVSFSGGTCGAYGFLAARRMR